MDFQIFVMLFILVNSACFYCILNAPGIVEDHRMKRSFYLRNGTQFTFEATVVVPVPATSDFVDGEVRITLPNVAYLVYTGFVARQLAQDQVNIFRAAEDGLSSMGLDGRMCILRTVCEVAANPSHALGLFGDVIDIIFR